MEIDEYLLNLPDSQECVLELGTGKSTEVFSSKHYNVVSVDKISHDVPDGVKFINADLSLNIYSQLKGYDFKIILFDLGMNQEEKAMNIAVYYLLKSNWIIMPDTKIILDNIDWDWIGRMIELLELDGYKIIDKCDRQCTMAR